MAEHADVICIGGGPAGLTAAYILSKQGLKVTVLEADPDYVGGISRTVDYKGFLIDIGGHRFFSKSREVEEMWTELLPDDMLERGRKSRILYRGTLFDYPLRARNALTGLGVGEATACAASYLYAQMRPYRDPRNFEEWVVNQFGRRLFTIFFKTYTEKVWGMATTEISADWAAQRINRLSLGAAVVDSLRPRRRPLDHGRIIKTLIDRFRYPRKGPGMMWDAAATKIEAKGGKVLMAREVTAAAYDAANRRWRVTAKLPGGETEIHESAHVISSAPLRDLFAGLNPAPPDDSRHSAAALRYRDFLIVGLIAKDRQRFDDNWIYVHDPTVQVGRIQNFKSWSPEMVPDPNLVCYGMEYFCFEGDGLWSSEDGVLIDLARDEIASLGLAAREDVQDGVVIRQRKAYPVYDDDYRAHVDVLRRTLAERYPNLHVVGRNGMHKYNNQDHAMMTAMLTAENILRGEPVFDVWQVNQDAEYHEAGAAGTQSTLEDGRAVPAQAV